MVDGPADLGDSPRFLFPRWANYFLPACVLAALAGLAYVPPLLIYAFSPQTTDVGYAPVQPVPFSHAMHAGSLGLDCRYCHSTVERASFAAVPPTQICMNCHAGIRPDSPKLAPVRESFATGRPIRWLKVHDLPDYVSFSHAAHLNKGVGCVTCHDRVDQMEVVSQARTLSMAWCLDCHRQPEKYLRPRERITDMSWAPSAEAGVSPLEMGRRLKAQYAVHEPATMTSCSTCHR